MEGKGLQALLCVLVIAGCTFAFAFAPVVSTPAVAVADAGPEAVAQADQPAQPGQPHGTTQAHIQDAADGQDNETDDEQGQNQPQDNETDDEQGQNQPQDNETDDQEPDRQTGSDQLNNADEIHIDVFVHENGSATFIVDYRFENDSSSDWEDLRTDVDNNSEMYVSDEMRAWNDTLENGENATDRDMELSNASISTDTSSAPQDLGHVTVTFEWSSFAYVELNRIEVGDVLTGFVLPQHTTMQVFPPEGYVINQEESSPDQPGNESVFWHGERTDFSSDPPSIIMIQNGNATTESPDDASTEEGPSMPWLVVLAALALLVIVGAAGWWIRDSGILAPGSAGPTGTTPQPAPDDSREDESTAGPPPELLSNEERVLRLLEQRGGRIKQQEVVVELDWTEAKTSQVVSGLREDGEIEVFRIGRENVLSLPDGTGPQSDGDADSGTGTGPGPEAETGPDE